MLECVASHEGAAPAAPPVLVPFPVPCLLDVSEGRSLARIHLPTPLIERNSNAHSVGSDDSSLSEGEVIRIHHPYHSANFEVSQISSNEITLASPYDHSPIRQKEDLARDTYDTIERLHSPYGHKTTAGSTGADEVDAACNGSSSPIRRTCVQKRVLICASNLSFNNDKDDGISVSTDGCNEEDTASSSAPCSKSIDEHSGRPFHGVKVWRLIPIDLDKRPLWRKQYDDGDAPSDYEYTPYLQQHLERTSICHFGIVLKESVVERLCRDFAFAPERSIHQQRVHYFDQVSIDFVVEETYRVVCGWHPACRTIDNVKWAKLSRKMKFLSSVRNTSHEVDMSFLRRCRDRKLDVFAFHDILEDVAKMQYPRLEQRIALKRLLWNTVVMLPYVNEKIWSEAKSLAMAVEAKLQCSQIRLAATFRGFRYRVRYVRMVQAAIRIEKHARRIIQVVWKRQTLDRLEKERIHCLRVCSATICQTTWRKYYCRQEFLERRRRIIEAERLRVFKLRRRLQVERARREACIVGRFARCIQGLDVVVTMSLHDASTGADKAHLVMKVYTPSSQKTFEFCFEEDLLQTYMQQIMGRDGKMSWNEMIKPHLLRKLSDRLMVRRIRNDDDGPIILFSKRNMAEQGTIIAKTTIRMDDGGIYILSIYKSPVEYTFCVYDPGGCVHLRTSLTHEALRDWLTQEDALKSEGGSGPKLGTRSRAIGSLTLQLLRPERQDDLVAWLRTRIVVKTSPETRRAQKVLFQFEADNERAERLACRIQSVFRKLAARARARRMVRSQFEKAYDRDNRTHYYVNKKSGAYQWTKPVLLGDDEDLEDPRDEWRLVSEHDGQSFYYHNLATGQTTWLSEEDAARMLQRRVRDRQAADILGPRLDFATIASAVKFINDAEVAFETNPQRLSHQVNYALICHCLKFNFDEARIQYHELYARCPSHPIIARAYAIFMLADCCGNEFDHNPRGPTVRKARSLFREADLGDPNARMFRLAIQNCFVWAVMVHPRNPLALLNSALLQQYVLCDPRRADKLYRRALAIDPQNNAVQRNYELFLSMQLT